MVEGPRVAIINEDGSFKNDKVNKFVDDKISGIKQRVDDINEVTVASDGSFTINTDYSTNIISPGTTPSHCFVEGDGISTIIHFQALSNIITWPEGTVVHGDQPVNGNEAFISLIKINNVLHALCPNDSSGTILQPLLDIIIGKVLLNSGNSVFPLTSENKTFGSSPIFTNTTEKVGNIFMLTSGYMSSNLTIPEKGSVSIYHGVGNKSEVKVVFANPVVPEVGSGWKFTLSDNTNPANKYSTTDVRSWKTNTFIKRLSYISYDANKIGCKLYNTDPDSPDPSKYSTIIIRYNDQTKNLFTHDESGKVTGFTITVSPAFSVVRSSLITPSMSLSELSSIGVTFPLEYLTPDRVAKYPA